VKQTRAILIEIEGNNPEIIQQRHMNKLKKKYQKMEQDVLRLLLQNNNNKLEATIVQIEQIKNEERENAVALLVSEFPDIERSVVQLLISTTQNDVEDTRALLNDLVIDIKAEKEGGEGRRKSEKREGEMKGEEKKEAIAFVHQILPHFDKSVIESALLENDWDMESAIEVLLPIIVFEGDEDDVEEKEEEDKLSYKLVYLAEMFEETPISELRFFLSQ